MRRRTKKKVTVRSASVGPSTCQDVLQRRLDGFRWSSLLKGSKLVFVVLTGLLIPIAGLYLTVAEPNLVIEGAPTPIAGRADPSTNSARILTEVTLHVRNRGLKSGHVERVEIRPSKFDQPTEVEVRYVDRRPIAWLQSKQLKFQFVQTIRHTGNNSFMVTFVDGNGKQIGEIQLGTQSWVDGQPAPPKTIPAPD